MLEFSEMITRFLLAIVLGALLGWEREIIHKEAGIRTSMLVCAGAALFAMIGLSAPHILSGQPGVLAGENGGLGIIANIVVGIGFLGAGLIIKTGNHVHSLTTAAVVWAVAAIGVLSGIGLYSMAIFSAISLTILLYLLRNVQVKTEPLEKA